MDKRQAMSLLALIADLYSIVQAPEPEPVKAHENGRAKEPAKIS
jgi:hypothetical protein